MIQSTRPVSNLPGQSARIPDTVSGFAQVERMIAAATRPFVLITERELSVLRRGLTKDGWKRALYLHAAPPFHGVKFGAGMLSIANRWLESEISIPDRAGFIHDFYCDCGERLVEPDSLQVVGTYCCAACDKVYSGSDYDGAVRYMQHNNLAGAARALAIVYGIEKDRAYAEKAAEILLKYADAYPGPHTDLRTGGMYLQSLDEAVWIIPLAQAYDLIYYSRCLSDHDKEHIERALFRTVADGLKGLPLLGNWGAWQLSAVGVIGLAIKDPALVRFALDSFEQQISQQLGDDGLWPESVHTFHFYALTAYVHFAEACNRAGIDIYNWEPKPGKSLKTMFTAPLEYAYPSLRLPAIHDGWCDGVLPLDLYEIAYRRWGDPAFAWVLKKGYKFGDHPVTRFQAERHRLFSRSSFYGFLFGRDLPGRTGSAGFRGHDFEDLGICVLRGSNDLMVTLDHGRFLNHGHLDKLGITLFANGAIALPDYGTPGFRSEIVRWLRSTPAHNTVVVDGANQQKSEKSGLANRYFGGYIQCAEAVADDCYSGVSHSRRLVVVGSTCIVADRLTSSEEHDYDWMVRCAGEPRLQGDYEAADVCATAYSRIGNDRAFAVPEKCALRWECENGEIAFSMWPQSASAAAVLGTCPTDTQAHSASLFMCRQHASDASFLAAIAATKHGGDIDVVRDGSVIRIETAGVVDSVYLKGWGAPSQAALETDAELAAVRTIGGEVVSIALVKGSWVKWNGVPLIECAGIVEAIEFRAEDHAPLISYAADGPGTIRILTSARAMRVNGFRASVARENGCAFVRVTAQMLAHDLTRSSGIGRN